ncbi:glutathione-disulfide reductase [Methylomonas sp. UP202]|uniref:glutathione-disulfide reductase n=1 Tax=Methylomonas sp. UP202 TaxID=3040943 RepID=UPI00143877DE|nr:glutathione-disulfide reductase [Methylomonas sp. UP202]NJA06246.1 glutathione-disulfide reductase [Methylococcaceae bacterium WWC4]WGS88209.1 glutathione-disulfide reductase [Methylomonas sp. UP202]
MIDYDYDLFVVGAGSGGVRAANTAANRGARVAIAEVRDLGGTCVNLGCVPKKLLVYASQFKDDFAAATGYGWTLNNAAFDWPSLIANKNREIERLHAVYQSHLQQSRVTIFNGKAQLLDAHTIAVAGTQCTAKRILIATGGWPFVPDIPGKQHIATSNELFSLKKLPKRIVIVGGGYIAVEFASILNGLGVDTTVCQRAEKLLEGFDEDIRDFLGAAMARQGVKILLNSDVHAIAEDGDAFAVSLLDGNVMTTDLVLYATGRTPNSAGFGLEELGVALDTNGAIIVNGDYQTNLPSVYALGDVTDRINLTPVAIAEGEALVNSLYFKDARPVDYNNIPTAVFSQPNIASVGLTEAQARQKYSDIAIYKTEFTPIKNTLSGKDENTLMKMIVEPVTDRVVGLHMIGADAPEIIQGMAIALRAGATKAIFDSTIGVHPTSAEEFVSLRTLADPISG